MKIKLNRELLEKKLSTAVSVLGNNVQPPILNEALFKMGKNDLSITTSDGGITMTVSLPYELENGEVKDFVCDIQSIIKPVTLQKSEFMFLEVMEKDILFSTPKTRKKYQIPITYQAIDFPLIKSEEWSDPVIIDGKSFANMIKKTSMLANPNDLRSGISGINLFAKDNTLYIQATNGSSAACETTFKPESGELSDIEPMLIPKAIAKVSSVFDKSTQLKISIDGEKRNIGLTDGSSITYVRLLNAKFPSFDSFKSQRVLNISTKVSKEDIILAIDRLSGFTNYDSKCLIFDMKGDGILMKSINDDTRKKAEELIETQHKSEEMCFPAGFNHTTVRSAISSLSGSNIFFSMTSWKVPMFISDDSSEGFQTLWILMGMTLPEHKDAEAEIKEEVQY